MRYTPCDHQRKDESNYRYIIRIVKLDMCHISHPIVSQMLQETCLAIINQLWVFFRRSFGRLSVPASRKWEELFDMCCVTLGCSEKSEVNTAKAWEKVASMVAMGQKHATDEQLVHITSTLLFLLIANLDRENLILNSTWKKNKKVLVLHNCIHYCVLGR